MASAITNMEIEALARGIGINNKLDGLGLHLGYEYPAIDIYKASNYSGAIVTHQGTKQMLKDWRDKTSQEQQRPLLKKALEDSELVRLAENHLGGEAATATGQAGKSETLSEQPCTQAQTGGTNTFNNSGPGTVSGNNMIGQQTNDYHSAPPAPAVHHHHYPARPVYIPVPAAPKRQTPKRAKVTASIPSILKGTTSKPKSMTSVLKGNTSKPKSMTSILKGNTSKPKSMASILKGGKKKKKKSKR